MYGLVAGLGITAWTTIVISDPAAAVLGQCPEGSLPGPGPSNPIWTDDNVSVYAGGDFRAEGGAAEAEGLMVVEGNASFTRTPAGTFNVGWIGVGSWVVPTPGSVMLAVGGDVTVAPNTVLDVGANARDASSVLLGGNVDVGGLTTPDYETDGTRYRLNNGVLRQGLGADATAPWASWEALLVDQSTAFAALAPTGTVAPGATTLEFTGLTGANPQVFTVDGGVLAANPAITFLNVAYDVPVIINVTGGATLTWAPNFIADESGRVDDPSSPRFGDVSSRTLWNIVDATAVHLAGTSQVLGTFLVPGVDAAQPSLRVTASTNGRLLTNGTIVMDGTGNEHHNYPWISEPFECIPGPVEPVATGSVTIAKEISPIDQAYLPENVLFHGVVLCEGPGEIGQTVAEWYVAPGESVLVDDLPVGASCVIEEAIGPAARAFSAPPSGGVFLPSQLAWHAPVWDPAPPEFIVPDAADPVQFTFTVTNALARGAFTIQKIVNGDAAPAVQFTVQWQCALGDGISGGLVTLAAGETTEPIPAIVGMSCSVVELTPAEPEGGIWDLAVIEPSSVIITVDSAQTPLAFVVENTFIPDSQLGGFHIVKVVTNPDGVEFPDSFSGSWSCTAEGSEIAGAAWTATTEVPFAVSDIAIGAECTVTETTPVDPAGGSWGTPEVTPETFTVTDADTPVMVTVTNVLTTDDTDDGGGDLPATGTTVPWWAIVLGVGLVGAGAAMVIGGAARLTRP
ncbi:choice-of-anchor A family protein [Microbacterium lacus]|uniref:choice-of-anchor A family protein n=1 Tax=Microbacterium lacus TaxID=415217 RepID=UPI00384B0834